MLRYQNAGLYDVVHEFYPGGRHEMLNEINRDEVRADLLGWVAAVLDIQKHGWLNTGPSVA
jgi:alpha-beta hydrolase superfamily lysophospholipase